MSEGPLTGWHLDKRVPLALIIALIAQTITFGMWVGSINTRVDQLEARADDTQGLRDRLIRIETLQETILERLGRDDG